MTPQNVAVSLCNAGPEEAGDKSVQEEVTESSILESSRCRWTSGSERQKEVRNSNFGPKPTTFPQGKEAWVIVLQTSVLHITVTNSGGTKQTMSYISPFRAARTNITHPGAAEVARALRLIREYLS